MPNESIPVDEEKLKLLKDLASTDTSLLEKVANVYSRQEEKYLDGYRAFVYGLLQPLGIIAGFGFTAIDSIKSLWLFITGEIVLIGAIIFAAYKTRQLYTSTLSSLAKESDANICLIWERVKFSSDLLQQALSEGKIPTNIESRQVELNNKMMTAFTPKPKNKNASFKDHLPTTLALTSIGILLVLLSFASF